MPTINGITTRRTTLAANSVTKVELVDTAGNNVLVSEVQLSLISGGPVYISEKNEVTATSDVYALVMNDTLNTLNLSKFAQFNDFHLFTAVSSEIQWLIPQL